MQAIREYWGSVKFVLVYSFRFVAKETLVMAGLYIISGALPYASAYLLGNLVNSIVTGTQTASFVGIWPVLFVYAVVTSLPAIVGNLQMYMNRRRMLPFQMEIEIEILNQRERIDIATYEDPKFQDLLQRTFRGGPNPIFQLSNAQFDMLRALSSLVIGTVLAVRFDLLVYVVVIATAIPAFYMDIKYAGKSWSIWAKDSPEQRRLADLRQHLIQRTFLIETKLLQAGKKLLKQIRKIYADFAQVQLGLEKKRLLHTSLADLLALGGFAVGLFLVVRSAISGEFQVGTIVYILGTLSSVRASIANLLEIVSGQYENHLIVRDMIGFMNTKPVIKEAMNPVVLNLTTAPEIVFEKVSFKYSNSDKYSLRNVNLVLRPGSKIGLVGNNGAGKTTFVKLLCRIYDPTEGRILINGTDLRDVSLQEWWSYLAVMFQDYATYDFLAKEAIAIGRPDATLEMKKVLDAAEISQSHNFISEWKNKYEHQIGVEFSGVEPSKGQRQKLSIAKIVYRGAQIMILDEPTASVDAESEARIFNSIENLSKDITALLISHDFSTISQCDQIFVLEEGKLIEEGSHGKLMGQNGKYAELYNLQAERFRK